MQHTVFESGPDTLITAQSLTVLSDCVVARVLEEDLNADSAKTLLYVFDLSGRERGRFEVTDAPDDLERRITSGVFADSTAADLTQTSALPSQHAMALSCQEGQASLDWSGGAVSLHRDGQEPSELRALDAETCAAMTKGAISGNWLYLGRADPRAGFDVLAVDLSDPDAAPKVFMPRGAGRFSLNAAVSAMLPTEGGVLIGTAALAGHEGQVGNWGPELLLLSSDGEWDLIVGQPRFSPEGLKLPAAGQGPGFDNIDNVAVSALLTGDQHVVVCQGYSGPLEVDRRKVVPDLMAYQGPVQIFVSDDLVEWQELPVDFGEFPGAVTCAEFSGGTLWLGFEVFGTDGIPVRCIPLG